MVMWFGIRAIRHRQVVLYERWTRRPTHYQGTGAVLIGLMVVGAELFVITVLVGTMFRVLRGV